MLLGGKPIGTLGIVHPEVLEAFEVAFPVSALEITLEPFCVDQMGRSMLNDLSSNVPA